MTKVKKREQLAIVKHSWQDTSVTKTVASQGRNKGLRIVIFTDDTWEFRENVTFIPKTKRR